MNNEWPDELIWCWYCVIIFHIPPLTLFLWQLQTQMHLALTSPPLWVIQTARFYSCFPLFSLSLSLLFFLPPKARPLLMFPWEQRGELAIHSSLVFTSWTVNVTHNQIVLCLQPFSQTCWFDIYGSVTGEVLKWSGRNLSACYRWSVGAAAAAGRRLPHKS